MDIPENVWFLVLDYVTIEGASLLERTSKDIQKIVLNEPYWKSKCQTLWIGIRFPSTNFAVIYLSSHFFLFLEHQKKKEYQKKKEHTKEITINWDALFDQVSTLK